MIYAALSVIIVAIANFIFGGVVYARKFQRPVNQSFMVLSIAVGVWALAIGFYLLSDNSSRALFYANVYYFAALLIAASVYVYVLTLLSSKALMTPSKVLLLAIPFVYACIAAIQPRILVTPLYAGSLRVTVHDIPYAIYAAVFLVLFWLAAVRLLKGAVRAKGRRRKQLSVVAAGTIVAGAIGVVTNLVLPVLGYFTLIWAGPVFSLFFLLSTAYAVVRYRLFDLRVALARTLAYVLALFTVIIIYASVLIMVGLSFFSSSQTSTIQDWIYMGMAVLLTFTFQPLKRFFDNVTRHIFFNAQFDPDEAVERIGDAILDEVELGSLSAAVFKVIDSLFSPAYTGLSITNHTNHTQLLVSPEPDSVARISAITELLNSPRYAGESIFSDDELTDTTDQQLTRLMEGANMAIAARIKTRRRHIGYLLVGHRKNGTQYSSTDLHIIETACDELSLAIENSLQFSQISEFNKTLQRRVDNATKELRLANNRLHELDESKDEFISMASHQLRTPLTSIKGYISMLLDGDVGRLTKEQQKLLEEAFNSSQRMVYLIGDFLNVSRLQTGKFELELSQVDMALIINEEIDQLKANAASRKIKLDYHPPTHVPLINVDENKIRQVMMNLIDNAIYYSPPDTTVDISLTYRASQVTFKVVDHGIGVPANEQHLLFTKFFRATNAKMQRPDGTGIGLYMAKKVIVAHGGAIIFESRAGKGSTFGFSLPLKKPDQLINYQDQHNYN